MTHIMDFTTEDLAAGILGMHDISHKEMVAKATKAINAAIAAAVAAETERCAKAAKSPNVIHGLSSGEIAYSRQTARDIEAAIRAGGNGSAKK